MRKLLVVRILGAMSLAAIVTGGILCGVGLVSAHGTTQTDITFTPMVTSNKFPVTFPVATTDKGTAQVPRQTASTQLHRI